MGTVAEERVGRDVDGMVDEVGASVGVKEVADTLVEERD